MTKLFGSINSVGYIFVATDSVQPSEEQIWADALYPVEGSDADELAQALADDGHTGYVSSDSYDGGDPISIALSVLGYAV